MLSHFRVEVRSKLRTVTAELAIRRLPGVVESNTQRRASDEALVIGKIVGGCSVGHNRGSSKGSGLWLRLVFVLQRARKRWVQILRLGARAARVSYQAACACTCTSGTD